MQLAPAGRPPWWWLQPQPAASSLPERIPLLPGTSLLSAARCQRHLNSDPLAASAPGSVFSFRRHAPATRAQPSRRQITAQVVHQPGDGHRDRPHKPKSDANPDKPSQRRVVTGLEVTNSPRAACTQRSKAAHLADRLALSGAIRTSAEPSSSRPDRTREAPIGETGRDVVERRVRIGSSARSHAHDRDGHQLLILGRETVDSASGAASLILTEQGRSVGSLGPGLTSDSADAVRAVLRDDLSAGPQVLWHLPAVPA
jgi:hypothetical protein